MLRKIFYEIKNFLLGLNTRESAYQLKKGEIQSSQDVRITDNGNIVKRTGFTKRQAASIEALKYVTSIYQHTDELGNKTDYCICGTKLYYWNGTAWTERTDSLGFTKTLSENKRASMFTYKDKLFVSNGEEPAFTYGLETIYSKDTVYVCEYLNKRVSYFDSSGTFLGIFGSEGTGVGQFVSPVKIAVDKTNSKLYVTDDNNGGAGKVEIYNLNGVYIGKFKGASTVIDVPAGIDVDETNSIVYLSNSNDYVIQRYDLNGNFIDEWGSIGTGNGEFNIPQAVAVDETNSQVYVADTENNRIQYFQLDGTYVGQWGSVGTGNSEFSLPYGIAVDETNSRVYVADSGNDRVQYFQLDGTYVGQWGSVGSGNGEFNSPQDILVDEVNSQVYVSDYSNDRIQIFQLDGTYVGKWGTSGSLEGQLDTPRGIALGNTISVSANVFKDLGSPGACKAADAGEGSGKTGTYKYKLTYVSTTSLESSGGIESNAVTVVDNEITLTEIPAPPNAGFEDCEIEYINIYRQKTSGAFEYIAQLQINSTTYLFSSTYTDSINDGSQDTTQTAPTVNNLVPTAKYMMEWKNVLWSAGEYNNPTTLYWTNPGPTSNSEDDWDLDYYEPIGESEGTLITGIKALGDALYVFKEDSIWYILPGVTINDDTPNLVEISEHLVTREFGCVSGFTIDYATVRGVNGLVFADKDYGICFISGTTVTRIADKVRSDWQALSKLYIGNAVGRRYEKYNEYWLSVTASGTTNNQVWIMNLDNGAIYKPFNMNVTSFGMINESGTEYLYSGDFNGWTYKQDNGQLDQPLGVNTKITGNFTTGWMDLGFPNNLKTVDRITVQFLHKGVAGSTMILYWAVDGGSFITGPSIDISGTAGVQDKYTIRPYDSTNGKILSGQNFAFKIENVSASAGTGEPFEVCYIGINARIKKILIGGD